MPHVADSSRTARADPPGVAHLDGDRLVIDDEAGLPRRAASATWPGPPRSATDEATVEAAQWLVWEASQALGAPSASIHDLYDGPRPRRGPRLHRAGDQHPGPDVRHGPDDLRDGRSAADVGAVIFELARSEQTYTFQRPIDYATASSPGAIAAGWRGPVFIQGDHYQFNAKKYAADPEAMTEEIRRACRLAIDAGYRNIDIDSSTLVDLSKPTVDEQQRENYIRAAELTALIRSLEADGVTVSVGGEIGEVGKQNSTVEELRAYLDGYRRELDALAPGRRRHLARSASRRARATAACRCPAAASPRSSSTSRSLRELGEVAREYGLAGRRPARRLDAARRAVPPLPRGRDRRDPPRDRLPERALRAPGVPRGAPPRDRGAGASPTRPTSARPTRPTSSSSTRPARRRSGRSSASCGTSTARTRSSPPSVARSRTCSASSGRRHARAWSTATSSRSSVHRAAARRTPRRPSAGRR